VFERGQGVTVDVVPIRMIAVMRLILAASALFIIYIDPSQPDHYVQLTYSALTFYTIYSAAILGLILAGSRIVYSLRFWSHWVDILWYTVLIALSSGTNSIFFMFFFFSILVTSFRWGFKLGLWSAVTSSVLFTIVGYATAPSEFAFELNRFLLRPTYLLVLGYMIAYWGGYEITLQRRLSLLKEINTLSNPRFGVARTIGTNMERLRAFYDADACLHISRETESDNFQIRRVGRGDPEGACRAQSVSPDLARQLLAPARDQAIYYCSLPILHPFMRYSTLKSVTGERTSGGREAAQTLAGVLDTRCFISIPMRHGREIEGRLYITSSRPVFRQQDIGFLRQAIDLVSPVLDNIRLVDRMASTAADEERRRIARDIHDSVIQPYIGLQLGLTSVHQKLLTGAAETNGDADRLVKLLGASAGRLQQLIEMTDKGIVNLRGFVGNLREGEEKQSGLLESIRRFCIRFSEATDIVTHVEADGPVLINDRLAAEVFQIIAEGLSNVRRHTHSVQATVRLSCSMEMLVLRIENDRQGGSQIQDFIPRSMAGRAESLQGRIRVEHLDNNSVAVIVEIPL
jgi:signal transduction histidine kinase